MLLCYAINIRVQMNEWYCCILNVYMNISRNPQWKKITIAQNAAWKEQFFGKLQLKLAREGSQHCLSTKITVMCQNSALLKHFQKSPKNPEDFLALSPSSGLSLRAGGRGFSPATKRLAPSYFYWKIEEK